MIAVVFEVEPNDERAYLDIAADLRPLLDGLDGFISVERFEGLATSGKILSASSWRDEQTVAAWRNWRAPRCTGKRPPPTCRDRRLRISSIILDYGMIEWAQAPADSGAAHK